MQINAIAKKNNDDEGVREDADEGPLRGVGGYKESRVSRVCDSLPKLQLPSPLTPHHM